MRQGLVMIGVAALLIATMTIPASAQRSSVGSAASGISLGRGGAHHGGHPSIGHGNPGSSWGRRMALLGFGTGYGGVGAGWGGWGAWYPGYPNDPLGYETGRIPTPPYFSIHPPVYYGKRVGMPYGNSTVTRPPRAVLDDSPPLRPFQTPPQPLMIENPFVVDASQTAGDAAAEANLAAVDNPQIPEEVAVERKRAEKQARRAAARDKAARSKHKTRKKRE